MLFLSSNQQCQSTEGKYHIPWTCLPQSHLGVFQLCLWPLIAPGYLGGGLPCLSSALWSMYPDYITLLADAHLQPANTVRCWMCTSLQTEACSVAQGSSIWQNGWTPEVDKRLQESSWARSKVRQGLRSNGVSNDWQLFTRFLSPSHTHSHTHMCTLTYVHVQTLYMNRWLLFHFRLLLVFTRKIAWLYLPCWLFTWRFYFYPCQRGSVAQLLGRWNAVSRAKLQSNHHHQQTNTQFFLQARCPAVSL